MFAIPEAAHTEHEGGLDADALVLGVEDMNVSRAHEELTNWRRKDLAGVTGDASIIEKATPMPEPNDEDIV